MNISNNPHLIHPAENPYRQFQPLSGLKPSAKTIHSSVKASGAANSGIKAAQPMDILSVREKETLHALFSGKSKEHSFYGTTRVKNIQSGFLLDIKG